MTCEEFKALAPAWAVGSLDADEGQACEDHLASARAHEGCESALARAEQAASLIWAQRPAAPPREVWDRIEQGLTRETNAAVRRASALPSWSRVSRTLFLAASVAVVSLIVGHHAGWVKGEKADGALKELQSRTARDLSLSQTARSHLAEQFDGCRRDLKAADDSLADRQRALTLLADPNTEVVGLAPQPNFNSAGSVILNRAKHKAMVFAKSLSPVANRDYELWVIRGDTKIPAGLLKVGPGGAALGLVDDQLLQGGVNAFAVTLEPAGGGTAPRGPLVLVGEVKKG